MVTTRRSTRTRGYRVAVDEQQLNQDNVPLGFAPSICNSQSEALSAGPMTESGPLPAQNLDNVPLGFAPSLCNSKIKAVSAGPGTESSPFAEVLPVLVNARSQPFVGRWPRPRARRLACRRDKSTAVRCTAKKGIDNCEVADNSPLRGQTQPSESLHVVQLHLNGRADCSPFVHPSSSPLQAVNAERASVDFVASPFANANRKVSDGFHLGSQLYEGLNDVERNYPSEEAYRFQSLYPSSSPSQAAQDKAFCAGLIGAETTSGIECNLLKDVTARPNMVVGSYAVEDKPLNSDEADRSNVTRAMSLNLSDVLMLDDESSTLDSKLSVDLVTVDGYRVRQDLVPFLKDISAMHGDIAAQCYKKSNAFRSLLVQNVCCIVQQLKTTKFVDLTKPEINNFRALVADIKSDNVNVGWLDQRLGEIHAAKCLLAESPDVKQAKRQRKEEIKGYVQEIKGHNETIRKLQEKINAANDKMELKKAEKKELDDKLSLTKDQVKRFHCESMTDGIL